MKPCLWGRSAQARFPSYDGSMRIGLLLDRTRARPIVLLVFLLILMGAIGRLTLMLFDGAVETVGLQHAVAIFLLGAVYDAVSALWWALPVALIAWAWPARGRIA